ncbi:hypothetical protein SAMN06272722_102733 [Paenibacillus sp. RU5A]|nr:hypothetical protein SAMN06272722_102733 [Paenibacillus sp. RU5A]SOC66782.1 hypothetical protein SAMN05880581_102264 [Paenibacillus sp. RU26A]SOC70069.1 hypothetical protein SAMN05880586_102733 [Paenibacillus sp. RU5M]
MEMWKVYKFYYCGDQFESPHTTIRVAKTASKAKSDEYRSYSDYDCDATFLGFLESIKVRKIGQSIPKKNEAPFRNQDRIDKINELIRVIGSRGRRFLYSKTHDRYAAFHWADGNLWLVDDYTNRPLLMNDLVQGQHRYFSHGGTLWGLVCDFRDYILGANDTNHNNGYGGLYGTHWAYPEEDMKSIQQHAIELGYLKPRV